MSKLPKLVFIPADNKEIKGVGTILNTIEAPFNYCKIVQYKQNDDFTKFIANLDANCLYKQIDNYNIAVVYSGNLCKKGQPIRQITNFLTQAKDYYFKNKIQPSLGFYKKYLIQE